MNAYTTFKTTKIENINPINANTWYYNTNIPNGAIIKKIYCGNGQTSTGSYTININDKIIIQKKDTFLNISTEKLANSIGVIRYDSDTITYRCFIEYDLYRDNYEIVQNIGLPVMSFIMIILIFILPFYLAIKTNIFIEKSRIIRDYFNKYFKDYE